MRVLVLTLLATTCFQTGYSMGTNRSEGTRGSREIEHTRHRLAALLQGRMPEDLPAERVGPDDGLPADPPLLKPEPLATAAVRFGDAR